MDIIEELSHTVAYGNDLMMAQSIDTTQLRRTPGCIASFYSRASVSLIMTVLEACSHNSCHIVILIFPSTPPCLAMSRSLSRISLGSLNLVTCSTVRIMLLY
jgi:hypothetical protein